MKDHHGFLIKDLLPPFYQMKLSTPANYLACGYILRAR